MLLDCTTIADEVQNLLNPYQYVCVYTGGSMLRGAIEYCMLLYGMRTRCQNQGNSLAQ